MVKYFATGPQISYIVSLACERSYKYDNTYDTLTRGEEVINLSQLSKRKAHQLIDQLKAEPKQAATLPGYKDLASERQVDYLLGLADRAGWMIDDLTITSAEGKTYTLDKLMRGDASALIEQLKLAPRRRTAKPNPNVKITEDGMYRREGVVYKVQVAVHGSGHLYAKRLVVDAEAVRDANGNITEPGRAHYERDASAIAKLLPEHRLTLADAKGFGDLYGVCIRCAATLTDEESIARGAGPVCAGKI